MNRFNSFRSIAVSLIITLVSMAFSPAVTGCGGGTGGADPSLSASQKGTVYYIDDHLGSAQIVANAETGTIYEEAIYPYGLSDGSSGEVGEGGLGADYSYTTKERDAEIGLIYFGRRYYCPEMGRWLTPDPLFLKDPYVVSNRPLEGNLYSFVRSNPSTFVDPDGEIAFTVIAGAAIIGAVALLDPGIANAPAPGEPTISSPRPLDHATNIADVATMLLPGINDARDGVELWTGRDAVDGYSIGWQGRMYAAVGLAIGSGAAYRSVAASDGVVRLGLGLGPSQGRMGFQKWSHQHGFSTWAELSGSGSFKKQVHEAMNRADEIHFNIQDVDMRKANTILSEYDEPLHGFTNYELGVLSNEYMDKAVWWKGDARMPDGFNPFD